MNLGFKEPRRASDIAPHSRQSGFAPLRGSNSQNKTHEPSPRGNKTARISKTGRATMQRGIQPPAEISSLAMQFAAADQQEKPSTKIQYEKPQHKCGRACANFMLQRAEPHSIRETVRHGSDQTPAAAKCLAETKPATTQPATRRKTTEPKGLRAIEQLAEDATADRNRHRQPEGRPNLID
jgi:hypothetical protein